MKFDHIAINSTDISKSVYWFVENLDAELIYEDSTWGLVSLGGAKIAFVTPGQHPPHVAMRLRTMQQLTDKRSELIEKGLECTEISRHRDGTESFYLKGPNNQFFEWIVYPDDDNY